MSDPEIVFDGVSKFYGEVLGVNRVSLRIPPGISSLVGPNGSGKTTLMNLMTGLIHPDRGTITIRGLSHRDPERLMRITGYATQFDSAPRGRHVVLSSHVLHEVDVISDRVILIANGHVIADGDIRGMRDEIDEHPRQYLVRCPDPSRLASRLFEHDHITQVQVHEDRRGLLVMTRSQNDFARALGQLAVDGHSVESVMPVDENVDALYKYLIGDGA